MLNYLSESLPRYNDVEMIEIPYTNVFGKLEPLLETTTGLQGKQTISEGERKVKKVVGFGVLE